MSPQELTTRSSNEEGHSHPHHHSKLIVPRSDFTTDSGARSQASSVHVVVTKDVPIENQERWLAMAHELSKASKNEPGCIKYDFVRSTEEHKSSTRFVIIEEVNISFIFGV
jgi:hypothetical protein